MIEGTADAHVTYNTALEQLSVCLQAISDVL